MSKILSQEEIDALLSGEGAGVGAAGGAVAEAGEEELVATTPPNQRIKSDAAS